MRLRTMHKRAKRIRERNARIRLISYIGIMQTEWASPFREMLNSLDKIRDSMLSIHEPLMRIVKADRARAFSRGIETWQLIPTIALTDQGTDPLARVYKPIRIRRDDIADHGDKADG